jgi:hypothetical protein
VYDDDALLVVGAAGSSEGESSWSSFSTWVIGSSLSDDLFIDEFQMTKDEEEELRRTVMIDTGGYATPQLGGTSSIATKSTKPFTCFK